MQGLTDLTEDELTEYGHRQARRLCSNPPTANGRAVAAVVFYRARDHWPDFYDISDETPMTIWAEMFDSFPFITPAIAERAVDAVAAAAGNPQPGDFIQAANELIIASESDDHETG